MTEAETQETDSSPKKKGRWLRRLLIALLVWLGADFAYSQYVAMKLRSWESSVERDEFGVLNQCEGFSMGDGKTAIALLHGINDTPYAFRKMAGTLAKSAHARAIRMPGFGEPVPVYAQSTADEWLAEVEREVEALRLTHDRVFLVAHSLGGAVAVQWLLRGAEQEQMIDGVILLAPAIEVSSRRSPLLPVRWWHRLSSGLVFTKYTHSPFPPDTQDPAIKDFPNRTPFTPRTVINETFRLIDSNRGRASEIRVPVLLVFSKLDMVNDHEAAAKWFEQLSSPRKELFWHNKAGHQLPYDLGWDEIAAKILEFAAVNEE